MARTGPLGKRYGKETITWTRFHLPPNLEWPTWPPSGTGHPAERWVGPLAGVEGATWSKITIGRMVEFPEEAVYMVQWRTVDELYNFLGSPACDEFLQHLPEHGHKPDRNEKSLAAAKDQDAETEAESARRGVGSLALGEEKSTSSTSATDPDMEISRRRRRFLILTHFEGRQTTEIKGRVTLSVFVLPVPKADENNSLWKAYQHMGATFGHHDGLPCRGDEESLPRYWNRRRVWFYGKEEEEEEDLSEGWMNRTFGGGSGANQSASGPGPKTLVCEFRVWNDEPRAKVNRHVEKEEAHARDFVFKHRWDEVTAEWMSRGRILAWKQERWDFRGVPKPLPVDSADEEEEEEKEEEGMGA